MSDSAPPDKNDPRRNLALIGYRGSGKSAVGAALAQRLGWTPVDTDTLVETDAGCTIREVFEREGERRFRTREHMAVVDACDGTHRVISVGGGAILLAENVSLLREAAVCVWLSAPVEELRQRIEADAATARRRPGLTGASPLDEVPAVLAQRTPLYRAAAHVVIDTAGCSVAEVAERVLAAVRDRLDGSG